MYGPGTLEIMWPILFASVSNISQSIKLFFFNLHKNVGRRSTNFTPNVENVHEM